MCLCLPVRVYFLCAWVVVGLLCMTVCLKPEGLHVISKPCVYVCPPAFLVPGSVHGFEGVHFRDRFCTGQRQTGC